MNIAPEKLRELAEDIDAAKAQLGETFDPSSNPHPRNELNECMCPVCVNVRVDRLLDEAWKCILRKMDPNYRYGY
jgi:hypothetical protein